MGRNENYYKKENEMSIKARIGLAAATVLIVGLVIFLWGSENPTTPAGYVGYITQSAIFGKASFLGTQTGPTSYGRSWMTHVVNVSVTPYTYNEEFTGNTSVLAKDSVKIGFSIHTIFKIKAKDSDIQNFVERYSTLESSANKSNDIVKVAYDNFLKEPIRNAARNEIQQFEALKIKDNIIEIGKTVEAQMKTLCKDTPFDIQQIVVGNIQYPESVANAVAEKMAASQKLEQIAVDAQRRIKEAEGIAKAMEIIQEKMTPLYLQHEAIEAQKAIVGSPNHTVIYVPSGPLGIPITGTLDIGKK